MGIHFDQTSPTKSCHRGAQLRLLTQANEGAVAEVSEASESICTPINLVGLHGKILISTIQWKLVHLYTV